MEEQPQRSEPVGAPTEYADAQEVPGWIANIVKTVTAMPILFGFICGGLPLGCGALACIVSLFI